MLTRGKNYEDLLMQSLFQRRVFAEDAASVGFPTKFGLPAKIAGAVVAAETEQQARAILEQAVYEHVASLRLVMISPYSMFKKPGVVMFDLNEE